MKITDQVEIDISIKVKKVKDQYNSIIIGERTQILKGLYSLLEAKHLLKEKTQEAVSEVSVAIQQAITKEKEADEVHV